MTKTTLLFVGMAMSLTTFAQNDSIAKPKQDTIKIGNIIIVNDKNNAKQNWNDIDNNAKIKSEKDRLIVRNFNDTFISINDDTIKLGRLQVVKSQDRYNKKNWQSMIEDGDFGNTRISIQRTPKKLKPVTTNWWVLDLGFTNLIDKTEPLLYTATPMTSMLPGLPYYPTSQSLKLRNDKSSNVNLWVVQQKVNLYKHFWNLKYGIGIEMYNFRFEQPISFSNTPGNYIYYDNVHFTKNKLFVEYLSIPVQLNFHSNPQNKKSFYASLGMSAGYLVQSHTKQISDERGKKKVNGNFNLNDMKLATIGELGVGSVRLYGSYSLTNLFDKNLTYFNMTPFAVGIRFSKF